MVWGLIRFLIPRLLKRNVVQELFSRAFLSCGSVNNPETSNYHLEMSFNEEEFAQFIADLINRFELNAKIIKRRNKYVVYLKSSEKIGDFYGQSERASQ